MADLTNVLLVYRVDGALCSTLLVERRREEDRCRVVGPVESETRAVGSGKVVEGDLGVGNQVLSCSWP